MTLTWSNPNLVPFSITTIGRTDSEDVNSGLDVLQAAEMMVQDGRNPNGNAFYASINVGMAEAISRLLQDHVKSKKQI